MRKRELAPGEAQVVELLEKHGKLTAVEIGEITGRYSQNVSVTLRTLRNMGVARISGWGVIDYPNHRRPAEWSLGNKPDAPPPARKPRKQVRRDYNKNHKALIRVQHNAKRLKDLGVWAGLTSRI